MDGSHDHRVTVDVRVDASRARTAAPGVDGNLVLSWLTAGESARFRERGVPDAASIVPLVRRARVVPMRRDRLLAGVACALPVAADDPDAVHPVGVFDHTQSFWTALLEGRGTHLVGVGHAPASRGRATLTLAPALAPCAGARSAAAPVLDGERLSRLPLSAGARALHLCAYVPRSYARDQRRRYPVVYLLPGLGGDERTRFAEASFANAVDAWSAASGREAILVGVDTSAPHGSLYVAADGRAERRLRDVVERVDACFRTHPAAGARVLAGQSTGGWNAISAAMRAPGLFGAVAAAAPDALDLERWLLTPERRIQPDWLAWMRLEDALGGPGQMLSLAHSWSPGAGGTPRWPADLASGEVREEVLARWLEHSPLRVLQRREARAALAGLEGRLHIGTARHDEFDLHEPARRFAQRLAELGIAHGFEADAGGHFDAERRMATLVTAALQALPA